MEDRTQGGTETYEVSGVLNQPSCLAVDYPVDDPASALATTGVPFTIAPATVRPKLSAVLF